MNIDTRKKVFSTIATFGPISRKAIAESMGIKAATIGFHLTALRKDGVVVLRKGKWEATEQKPKDSPKKEAILTPPAKPAPEPSLMVLLVAAREALNEAIERVEALENMMLGGS